MKRNFNSEQCTGCGNCLNVCPKNLLTFSDNLNSRGLPYIVLNHDSCLSCGLCALMCTAGAVWMAPDTQDNYDTFLRLDAIPPHRGCSLGILGRLLAEVIHELDIQKHVVLFGTSDVSLKCESYVLSAPECLDKALAYKLKNPGRIVICVYPDSKKPAHEAAVNRFSALRHESITIIHTLNYFTQENDYQSPSSGASNILEQVQKLGYAGFIARSGVKNPRQVKLLKEFIWTALHCQIEGRPFSIVEMIFPCPYRLEGRPQNPISPERLNFVKEWFAKEIEPSFPVGILINDKGL